MSKAVKKEKTYRHTPAFILLFLARGNLYGAGLLKVLEGELPCYHTDTAVIYRTLQELEQEGAVKSYWETDIQGPARKWYEITDKGLARLAEFKDDIEMRMKNFAFFLDTYMKINKAGLD